MRKRSGSQPVARRAPPSSGSGSRARPWPCEMPPAGLKPISTPVRSQIVADHAHHHELTGSVALTSSLPVEVLMKSAPAIMQTIDALRDVAQRLQVAGAEDRLQMRIAAGRAKSPAPRRRAPASRRSAHAARVMTMSISARAVRDRRLDLLEPQRRCGMSPAGKPVDDRGDRNARCPRAPRPRSRRSGG